MWKWDADMGVYGVIRCLCRNNSICKMARDEDRWTRQEGAVLNAKVLFQN